MKAIQKIGTMADQIIKTSVIIRSHNLKVQYSVRWDLPWKTVYLKSTAQYQKNMVAILQPILSIEVMAIESIIPTIQQNLDARSRCRISMIRGSYSPADASVLLGHLPHPGKYKLTQRALLFRLNWIHHREISTHWRVVLDMWAAGAG